MLQIQKKLTNNFTAMSGKQNKYIVVHYVGAVSTAADNAAYFANNKVDASAHYFVDEISWWQSVEDYNKAWHCGGGLQGSKGHTFYQKCTNSNSIGIEMCVKKKDGKWFYEPSTIQNTIDLVRHLMDKYSIPITNVIRHFDVTGKDCPALYTDDKLWQTFKDAIAAEPKEEIDMKEMEKLQNQINELTTEVALMGGLIKKLSNPMIYNYIDENMPEYAVPTIRKLCEKGLLKGDEKGELGLDDNMLRMLVISDRAGLYKEV